MCSNDKDACISDVLCYQEGGIDRIWNLRFHRNFHERELGAALSFLEFIQSWIPRGGGDDTSHWCLKGNGMFGKLRSLGGWQFFVWIAVHGQIITLDNLMLRGRILVNRCCMCHRNEDTVDHLLLHCPVAHSLWVYMFQIFGTQ